MSDRTDGIPTPEARPTASAGGLPPAFRAAAPSEIGSPSAALALAPAVGAVDSQPPTNAREIPLESTGDGWGARFERRLTRLGDRLNPILVKETRQAFKSRQFTIWFSLLLGLGWLWSFFGVIQIGAAIYDGAYGADLFIGYYTLLSFCLLVVVPFVSFRSLATEREDKTYDLLQITTLRPSQIISGKLGSAAAQVLLYGSAIAPCIAFTYLLRGVPLLTMSVVVVYLVLASLGLSMVGVFAATLSKNRGWQTVLSLLLIVGLLYAFGLGVGGATVVLSTGSMMIGEREFWLFTAVVMTAYLGIFALLFAISTAQITFSADNRSTPGRITTLVLQMLFAGWCGYFWLYEVDRHAWLPSFFMIFSLMFWYAVGMVLETEPSEPSRRVRRGLPTSFLGRVALTWFYPGPSGGYVFAMTNAAAAAGLTLFAREWSKPDTFGPYPYLPELTLLVLAYITIYLGVGNLLGAAVRRTWRVPHAPAMLINVMLILGGMAAPNLLQWAFDPNFTSVWDYRFWHASNPFWTIQTIMQSPTNADAFTARWIVMIGAVATFLLNVPGIVHEIRYTRTPPPKRVTEDDAELHPAPAAAPAPSSPWG